MERNHWDRVRLSNLAIAHAKKRGMTGVDAHLWAAYYTAHRMDCYGVVNPIRAARNYAHGMLAEHQRRYPVR